MSSGSYSRWIAWARGSVLRALVALLLACAFASAAAAYTLVMRGGRRVEVPERFLLTETTLTYETAPGISVTLQLAHVDIAATERENREARGGPAAKRLLDGRRTGVQSRPVQPSS